MKNIFVVQTDWRILKDVLDTLYLIDEESKRLPTDPGNYNVLVNPVDSKRAQSMPFQEILGLAGVDSLDTVVLPVYMGQLPDFKFKDDPKRYGISLPSMQTALRYRKDGYQGYTILTMHGDYSTEFEYHVAHEPGRVTENQSKENMDIEEIRDFLAGRTSFIRLYSTRMPMDTKKGIFLLALEGKPQYELEVIDLGARTRNN